MATYFHHTGHYNPTFTPTAIRSSLLRRWRWCSKSFKRGVAVAEPPPADFNLKGIKEKTFEHVKENYSELVDLVENGTLLVHTRPHDYVERRTDGYQEPIEIFVFGSNHYSEKSAEDAVRVIRAVCPENVSLELCRSRIGILTEEAERPEGSNAANPMSLGGENFFDAVSRAVSLGGTSALAMRALLGTVAKLAAEKVGFEGGREMRASAKAAEEIDASVVLGDRPVEVTLERAWAAMTWSTRVRTCGVLISSLLSSKFFNEAFEETVREEGEDQMDAFYELIAERFPELGPPIIYERDMYTAWCLKRSKAVNGTQKIVGVVGRTHMRGIMYTLMHKSDELRFRNLVHGKNGKDRLSEADMKSKIMRRLALDIALGVGCYAAWVNFVH